MTIASAQSGTQTAVISTDHLLGSAQTTAGFYILKVSLANLAAGDRVEIRVDTKVISSGSYEVYHKKSYSGVQGEVVVFSPGIPVDVAIRCYITQTDGTGRDFDWNLLVY